MTDMAKMSVSELEAIYNGWQAGRKAACTKLVAGYLAEGLSDLEAMRKAIAESVRRAEGGSKGRAVAALFARVRAAEVSEVPAKPARGKRKGKTA